MWWTVRTNNELYVYRNGQLIYKRWYRDGSLKKTRSVIFNDHGWPAIYIDA